MKLRKHQAAMQQITTDIKNGSQVRDIFASVTPGGGKSLLPIILCQLIPKIADRVCWVVPRKSLQTQGEREFIDWESPHRLRAAENSTDMVRGSNGYITTYQAIGSNNQLHIEEFKKHRYILFLDEPHHVQDGGEWYKSLFQLVDMAIIRIFASGTFYRGDSQKIGFLPYIGNRLAISNGHDSRLIKYSRADALKDRAIVPLHFIRINGQSNWIDKEGAEQSAELKTGGEALFTALRTEYADHLLTACFNHWIHYRANHFDQAKLLIVAPNIELAEKYQRYIYKMTDKNVPIATSKEDLQARQNIAKYKTPGNDILVTVAMAYEGLSVKQITHIACLTHIRSIPWLEQLFARGNRLFPGKKEAFCFGPADRTLLTAIKSIEREQAQAIQSQDDSIFGSAEPLESGSGETPPRITPLSSTADDFESFETSVIEQQYTPSEIEGFIKKQIRGRIKYHLDNQRAGNQKTAKNLIYRKIKFMFKKKIDEMHQAELEKCLAMVVHST